MRATVQARHPTRTATGVMVAVARAPATYKDAAEGCGTEEVVAEVTATPAQDSTKITTGGAPGPRFL